MSYNNDEQLLVVIKNMHKIMTENEAVDKLEGAGLDDKDELKKITMYRVVNTIRIDIK